MKRPSSNLRYSADNENGAASHHTKQVCREYTVLEMHVVYSHGTSVTSHLHILVYGAWHSFPVFPNCLPLTRHFYFQ